MPQTAKKKAPKPRLKKKAEPATATDVPVATAGDGYVMGSRVSHPMFGDGAVTVVTRHTTAITWRSQDAFRCMG